MTRSSNGASRRDPQRAGGQRSGSGRRSAAKTVPASRRFLAASIATGVLLVLGVLAAGDLGFTALAALIYSADPAVGLIGDLGGVLSYFTFYPSVAAAAVTMVVGAVVVWREPRLNRLGVIIVVSGILSAAFVALILLTHALK